MEPKPPLWAVFGWVELIVLASGCYNIVMKKYIYSLASFAFLVSLSGVEPVMADGISVQGSLDSNTPQAKSIDFSSNLADLAWIRVTAASGDLLLRSIQLGTDVPGGLSNFAEIRVFDANTSLTVGSYPTQAVGDSIVFNSVVTIPYGQYKTYILRGSLSQNATGVVRVGIKDVGLATTDTFNRIGFPVYGNLLTLPGQTPVPSPVQSVTPSPSSSPGIITTVVTPTPVPSDSGVLLFRKVGDTKVYYLGVDGQLHWVKTLEDFVAAKFKWQDVQVISTARFSKMMIASTLRVKTGIVWLNIRSQGLATSPIVGKAYPNQEFSKMGYLNGWFKILLPGGQAGWFNGSYVTEIF